MLQNLQSQLRYSNEPSKCWQISANLAQSGRLSASANAAGNATANAANAANAAYATQYYAAQVAETGFSYITI